MPSTVGMIYGADYNQLTGVVLGSFILQWLVNH